MAMRRRSVFLAAAFAGITGAATWFGIDGYGDKRSGPEQEGTDDYETIRVPGDQPTVQEGVDAATEGDLVLVRAGTYEESVNVTTPGITLRGIDRNGVVFDGQFERSNGVAVEADRVAVENLTVRHYQTNGVTWYDTEGFRGSYLTAYNNGYYGIYAYYSRDGRFEYSYASGHPDAGFYLGRNQPFEAVISDVVAEYNGVGYSGTNTGQDVTIKDSIWRHNRAGIVPNTLDDDRPPQHASRIVGNVVYDNDNDSAPITEEMYPTSGTGILLWGGNDNLVEENVVDGHDNYGIALHPTSEDPSGNVIRRNVIRSSGGADLALGRPTGDDNRFEDNQFARSLPADVDLDPSEGSDRVAEVFDEQERRAEEGDVSTGSWRDQPEPGVLPTMRDPEAPPRPASKSASWEP